MSSVTVSSFQTPDWRWGGTTGKLRLYASKPFTDSFGVPHLSGTVGSKTGFYQEINLTISGSTVTVPTFTTYSTTDARPGGDDVRITGVLFDSKGAKRDTLFSGWRIPETPASTTWATLETFNRANSRINKPENVLSDVETAALIQSIAGTINDASEVIKGRTKLSLAPASASNPIAVGDNDPRVPTQPENDAMVGTSGSPSSTNPFVTNLDARVAGWYPQGTVMQASFAADEGNIGEPSLIYEGSPVILTDYSSVFKMWFGSGWNNPNIWYAESPDGFQWTRRATAVIANHVRCRVFKNGATYYAYASNAAATQIDRYTSADGVTFVLATAGVITTGGAWESAQVQSSAVWVEGATWYMLYEAAGGSGVYAIGLATSPDGITWTKSASNPVISSAGSNGRPTVPRKIGSTYYVWVHRSASSTLPLDTYRLQSTNLTTWTNPVLVYYRTTFDEGVNRVVGQASDVDLIEIAGRTYLFYAATPDGTSAFGGAHIKLAIANSTIANLVATNEGVNITTVGMNPFLGAWIPYTPTVTSTVGTITTVGVVKGAYRAFGTTIIFRADVTITTNGTGAGVLRVSLPFGAAAFSFAVYGVEGGGVTSRVLRCSIDDNGTVVNVMYDNPLTYPGANGARFVLTGVYEIPDFP